MRLPHSRTDAGGRGGRKKRTFEGELEGLWVFKDPRSGSMD